MVLHTIKHRVYRGEMVHRGQYLPGHHQPIISENLWKRAHRTYLLSKWHRRSLVQQPVPVLLKGLLFDRVGQRIHHTFMHAKGHLYRYYIAGSERRRYGAGSNAHMRFRAAELEQSVLDVVYRMVGTEWSGRNAQEKVEFLRRHVGRIDLDLTGMCVHFRTGASVNAKAAGRIGKS